MSAGHALAPLELCDAAARLLSTADEETAGLWPRAAAILTRQALEVTLGYLWTARAPGAEDAPMRAQLAALPVVLRDADLAGRVSYAWWALTRACHHHHYELPPTLGELETAARTVRDLVEAVAVRV